MAVVTLFGLSPRKALATVLHRQHLRRTVGIALVVGTILMLINHFDTIVSGDATRMTWVKVGLTYCVPFVVSNLGLLAGRRTELSQREDRPSHGRDRAARQDVRL
jgi:hypothetical protein